MDEVRLDGELAARLRRVAGAVVLSGAGVSKESGLGTFRGAGGLWEDRRPEELATPEAFYRTPGMVWRWYASRYAAAAAAQPNPAHRALVRWEALFPSFLLATQNVDDLHQRAGSRQLVALHGTIAEAMCDACGRRRPMGEAVAVSPGEPPACGAAAGGAGCRGRFRPAVVWFGESLPAGELARASRAAAACGLLLAAGTSALVYPAAGLIETALRAGACVIEVNPEPTPFSRFVHLRLAAPAGEAVPALTDAIAACRSAPS
ncbi:MAG TPA: NAD-dependent protein deacylase [Thermoanaerobaculia bacterium]|nr:NAD-dependent protein deacylase [Thermoanaerobaculia bacterium]